MVRFPPRGKESLAQRVLLEEVLSEGIPPEKEAARGSGVDPTRRRLKGFSRTEAVSRLGEKEEAGRGERPAEEPKAEESERFSPPAASPPGRKEGPGVAGRACHRSEGRDGASEREADEATGLALGEVSSEETASDAPVLDLSDVERGSREVERMCRSLERQKAEPARGGRELAALEKGVSFGDLPPSLGGEPEPPEILKGFTREVLRNQPANISEFAAKYFGCLAQKLPAEDQASDGGASGDDLERVEGIIRDLFRKYDFDAEGYLDPWSFKALMNDLQERMDFPKSDCPRDVDRGSKAARRYPESRKERSAGLKKDPTFGEVLLGGGRDESAFGKALSKGDGEERKATGLKKGMKPRGGTLVGKKFDRPGTGEGREEEIFGEDESGFSSLDESSNARGRYCGSNLSTACSSNLGSVGQEDRKGAIRGAERIILRRKKRMTGLGGSERPESQDGHSVCGEKDSSERRSSKAAGYQLTQS